MAQNSSEASRSIQRIFVAIAAPGHSDIGGMIADLYARAHRPGRVFIGLAWHMTPAHGADIDLDDTYKDQVRVSLLNANQMLSAGWLRTQAQKLWQGEEFILSLAPRQRLLPDWDRRLIEMLEQCDSDAPVLSSLPPRADAGDNTRPIQPVLLSFDSKSTLPLLSPRELSVEDMASGRPVRSAFCHAGFLFGSSQILRQVPADPYICSGEEDISLSIRLWSCGWDVFVPASQILAPTSLETSQLPEIRQEISQKRVRHLLGITSSDEREPLRDLERYGVGSVRSIAAFERFSGVSFRRQFTEPRAAMGALDLSATDLTAQDTVDKDVVVTPTRLLDLRKIRSGNFTDTESSYGIAMPDLSGLDRQPIKVVENDQVLVYDDFLPELICEEVYRWAIYTSYQHINTGQTISRTWRPHDGFPMRSLEQCVYEDSTPNSAEKKSWQYPTQTAFDLFAERIAEFAPEVNRLIGRRGSDWVAFSIRSFIYPARSGLSLHRDNRAVSSGGFAYFLTPQWDAHWGGILGVMDPRTQIGRKPPHMYGGDEPGQNVWLDRDREAPFVFDPGLGQMILPKRNRLVFIRPDCYRMITHVNEFAGDNVMMTFSGQFHPERAHHAINRSDNHASEADARIFQRD